MWLSANQWRRFSPPDLMDSIYTDLRKIYSIRNIAIIIDIIIIVFRWIQAQTMMFYSQVTIINSGINSLSYHFESRWRLAVISRNRRQGSVLPLNVGNFSTIRTAPLILTLFRVHSDDNSFCNRIFSEQICRIVSPYWHSRLSCEKHSSIYLSKKRYDKWTHEHLNIL